MPLENRGTELIPNNSAQAGGEDKRPIPKLISNSSEQTVEADNAQPPSLFQPMEAKSVSTDHSSWDSTTGVIRAMQLRQRDPPQRPSEAYCESCNTIIDPDGIYLYGICPSCLDSFVPLDAFVDSIESQSQSERAVSKPPDHAASAGFVETLHPEPPANVEKAKGYMDEGFPLWQQSL